MKHSFVISPLKHSWFNSPVNDQYVDTRPGLEFKTPALKHLKPSGLTVQISTDK